MANRYRMDGKILPIDTPLGPLFEMTPEARADVIVAKLTSVGVGSSRITLARQSVVQMIVEAEAVAVAKAQTSGSNGKGRESLPAFHTS